MTEIKKISFLILIGLIAACTPNVKRHLGQWELSIENQTKVVIIVSKDTIAFHEYYETKCDTIIDPPIIFIIEHKERQGNLIKLEGRLSDGYINNVVFIFKDNVSGELCITGENNRRDCLTFKKSYHDVKSKMITEEKDIHDYRYTIANEILSNQNKIEILRQKKLFLKNTLELLNYIDSLEIQLLLQYDLDYATINCWHKLDSLTSSYTSSIFLLGDMLRIIDAKYNGLELEKKLSYYLKNQSKEIGIEVIFPTFTGDLFVEYGNKGEKISWAFNKFSLASLGISIKELENLKLKIIQVDLINQYSK